MSEREDDPVDALLLERFEGPVPDEGFCDGVMQRLPPRRHDPAWPLAAGVVAGVTVCWLSLLSSPLLRIGWRDWLSGERSASAVTLLLVTAGISLLTLAWTMAEADDGRSESGL
ncbi:MAG: hypothetical protein WDM91_17830 [Rhizomicrobium sp.]